MTVVPKRVFQDGWHSATTYGASCSVKHTAISGKSRSILSDHPIIVLLLPQIACIMKVDEVCSRMRCSVPRSLASRRQGQSAQRKEKKDRGQVVRCMLWLVRLLDLPRLLYRICFGKTRTGHASGSCIVWHVPALHHCQKFSADQRG